MGHNTARELVLDETDDPGSAIVLELDVSPRCFPRFVTGATAMSPPEISACAYCGALVRGLPRCASCGAPVRAPFPGTPPVSRFLSPIPRAPLAAMPAPSRSELFVDAVATIPFGFWKRVPVYAFLAMVVGNTFRCSGLSGRMNLSLAVLIVVGVVGAVLTLQRSP